MKSSNEILLQYFGFQEFREGQKEIIEQVLSQRDTLALMPTGGGKSICYQIPALQMEGTCLVVSPLIALMDDQSSALAKKNIQVDNLGGPFTPKNLERISNNWLVKPPKFIFTSPERLNNYWVIERLKLINVNLIVFDEAHCISHWGHQFRPHYRKVSTVKKFWPKTPILALTATATPEVQTDIISALKLENPFVFKGEFLRKQLRFALMHSSEKSTDVRSWCKTIFGSKILYVNRRLYAEKYAQFLTNDNVAAKPYHAGLSPTEKKKISDLWINNKLNTICATSAFGMGIDKPDVRLVINPFLSNTPEDLYQEAGRAGRDGKSALALAMYNANDIKELKNQLVDNFPSNDELLRQYKMLYNHFQLAFNSELTGSHIYDLDYISKQYNCSAFTVFQCLTMLEKEGILELTIDGRPFARIKILMDVVQLHAYNVKNKRHQSILELLVRAYPGIVTQHKSVQIEVIASKLSIPELALHKLLSELHQLKIIDYQEKSNKPLVGNLEPRLDRKPSSFKLVNQLRDIAKKQFEFFNLYINENQLCRQQLFAEYFGTTCVRCNVCDNCLKHNKEYLPTAELVLDYFSEQKKLSDMKVKFPSYLLYPNQCEEIIQDLIQKKRLEYRDGVYFRIPN